jgi:hypothetical protein
MSEYDEKAQTFLDRFGLKVRASQKGDRCPPWCGDDDTGCCHGDRYRVTVWRRNDYIGNEGRSPRRLSFDFWNSLNEAPTAYDVLACVGADSYCPSTFEDFCREYGYDEDSRKTLALFMRCDKFAQRIRNFFTEGELEALAEII